MDSLIRRLDAAKNLMEIAENLYYTDCEQSTIIATSAELILKKVNEGFANILNTRKTISIDDYEGLLAGTEPPRADDTETSASANARRNFTIWAKTLNLQSGHLIYFGDVPFRLSYDKARATLTTQTRAGKTIVGYSPSGAIKAYLKSIGSVQANVDGWRRLTLAFENDYKPIGWSDWILRVWDIEAGNFKLIE